ncbi:MAG: hypothetical protein WCH07_04465 [Deltaproteobacteria bacterium]
MKKCPFCDETIQDAAIKCRYCEKWLNKDVPHNASSSGELIENANKIVVSCLHCNGRLRLPDVKKSILVTCPHCKNKFIVDHTTVKLQENVKIQSPSHFKFSKQKYVAAAVVSCILILLISGVLNFSQSGKDEGKSRPQEQKPSPVEEVQPTRPPVSLPNGTEITPARKNGHSMLTVDNGTSNDATIKLVYVDRPKKHYRFAYVKAKSKISLQNINSGNYYLQFCMGQDWDQQTKKFKRDLSYARFNEPMEFNEFKEEISRDDKIIERVKYSRVSVTLHPVVAGTARTHSISKEDFEETDPG